MSHGLNPAQKSTCLRALASYRNLDRELKARYPATGAGWYANLVDAVATGTRLSGSEREFASQAVVAAIGRARSPDAVARLEILLELLARPA